MSGLEEVPPNYAMKLSGAPATGAQHKLRTARPQPSAER
jgi:hypothetical protein